MIISSEGYPDPTFACTGYHNGRGAKKREVKHGQSKTFSEICSQGKLKSVTIHEKSKCIDGNRKSPQSTSAVIIASEGYPESPHLHVQTMWERNETSFTFLCQITKV